MTNLELVLTFLWCPINWAMPWLLGGLLMGKVESQRHLQGKDPHWSWLLWLESRCLQHQCSWRRLHPRHLSVYPWGRLHPRHLSGYPWGRLHPRYLSGYPGGGCILTSIWVPLAAAASSASLWVPLVAAASSHLSGYPWWRLHPRIYLGTPGGGSGILSATQRQWCSARPALHQKPSLLTVAGWAV